VRDKYERKHNPTTSLRKYFVNKKNIGTLTTSYDKCNLNLSLVKNKSFNSPSDVSLLLLNFFSLAMLCQ
jgi:hypothetical protein